MTPETFILNHPFPKNGSALNNKLVKDIQDPSKQNKKQENLHCLFDTNARLIYLVYKQFGYNQPLASIMSFTYEGLCKATETYDFSVGVPFYNYAMQIIRGLLQNWYNYNNDIVHIPVMKKKDIKVEYADINDYTEFVGCDDDTEIKLLINLEDENISEDLDTIIDKFEKNNTLSEKEKNELSLLKLSRTCNINELSSDTGISKVKIKSAINRCIYKMREYALYGVNNGEEFK